MSAVIETGDAPLELEQLTQLRSVAAGKTRAERGRLIPGVGREGMAQALAGLPVRPATRALIRLGLERLAAEEKDRASVAAPPKNAFPWSPHLTPEMKAAFASGASALVRAPVCPRCLGLEPGTPGGTPEEPHPGPFTEGLCAACKPNAVHATPDGWTMIRAKAVKP